MAAWLLLVVGLMGLVAVAGIAAIVYVASSGSSRARGHQSSGL